MTVAITRKELGAVELRREARRCRDAAASRRMLALALVLEGASRGGGARRGAARRHGPAGLARLGGPPQRGGPPRPARPAAVGARGPAPAPGGKRGGGPAWAGAGEGGGGGDGRRPGPGSRPGGGGALARGRPAGPDRGPLRGPPARAHGRQGAARARLRPPVGAAQAPEGGRGGAGGVQKGFADLVAGALPGHARGKPVEVWFQDEARVRQQGTLTRVWARRGTRPRGPRRPRHISA